MYSLGVIASWGLGIGNEMLEILYSTSTRLFFFFVFIFFNYFILFIVIIPNNQLFIFSFIIKESWERLVVVSLMLP
jgi:hypothetical protein